MAVKGLAEKTTLSCEKKARNGPEIGLDPTGIGRLARPRNLGKP